MLAYSEHEIKHMAAQITDAASNATKQSSEKIEIISIDDSDTNDYDPMSFEFDECEEESEMVSRNPDTSHAQFEDPSVVAFCSSISWPLDKPPHIPILEATKTFEPDNLDEETRQLQQEIEEHQQKLARMMEKKRLLAEIKTWIPKCQRLVAKYTRLKDRLYSWNLRYRTAAKRSLRLIMTARNAAMMPRGIVKKV